MTASKKDKKNGKEGRVAAEVTKNAPKFTYVSTSLSSWFPNNLPNKESPKDSPRGPSPVPSLPALQSPELKPSYPSSNGPSRASPMLDAVSTTSFATSASPSMKDWNKGVPAGMAGSPGNLISLMGDSPPTQPSSYEYPRPPSGWSSPRPANFHQTFGASPAAASPPSMIGRHPLSYQSETRFSPPDLHTRSGSSAAAAARRSSMQSHFAHQRNSPNPPLPYQPQAHFYGVTDIDNFDLQPQSGLKAGERGYYFGFDTLPCLNVDHVPGKGNVALAGYEGGLEVHAIGRRGLEHIASLKGLRGGVYYAKILPWTAQNADVFPLVAVVVHGPEFPLPAPGINEGGYDAVSADRSDAISNANPDTGAREGGVSRPTPGYIEAYQTAVEVYSLKTNKLVQVLLEAPKVPLSMPITSPIFKPPPPSGAFNIKADGSNIIVSSGITGECWVYRHMIVPSEQSMQFVCLGKVWTTLQHAQTEDATGPRNAQFPPKPTQRPVTAIYALNGSWLAYCPATPQSQITLRASPTVPRYGKTPGLASMTPPQLPSINSEVDLPMSESVMNKIMRDATQELIHGAKWVGKHGWSAWNKYWNPPTQLPARSPPPGSQGWGGAHAHRQDAAQFPPTHSAVTQPLVPKEPGLISILDLDSLSTSSSLHPVVTFQVPHGCSFLSLAPSGLLLFTASSKGDVHTVWDLMRTHHTRASNLQPSTTVVAGSPRVRQVAQFSRMTVARVVDVSWTRPNGERAAMVTERGTVHLFDLPSSAFTWPPPRRRSNEGEGQAAGGEAGQSAVAMASNALSSVRNAAGPLISRPRRSNSNVPVLTGSGLVEGAAYGGKAIVAGISHSLGVTGKAAFNQLRHNREKRVSLPGTVTSHGASCVVWIRGRKNHHLFGLGDGLVRTFPPKSRRTGSGVSKSRTARPTRYTDFKLRQLPDDVLSLSVRAYMDPDEYLDLPEKGLDSGNNAGLFNDRYPTQKPYTGSAIPQAEIESSAPYQPFHTDRRVALYELGVDGGDGADGGSTSLSVLLANTTLDDTPAAPSSKKKQQKQQQQQVATPTTAEAWAFGQPINATKLDLGLPAVTAEELFNIASGDLRALPSSAMETVYRQVGDAEQIVVTTRRRRGPGRGADADEDGFFEDDCEVLDFADQRV
ncbi:hypothetical protein CONLIGDRAFT_610923 [Coniochaeta ligniaria NRRL 30616]|uniref:WD40 repeat-like protein n=1 Tax=Coniochaeta ligniaria NRRL 30616 TaxID=1408157 RepID=A0A1J7J2D2_9PEZI|nr:hypothetical protein CONLIGDRAFT_610923 [Coniochaeta ligniaria NRRL 30616]